MGRDDATAVDAPRAPIGRVRVTDDSPPADEPPATSRDLPLKIALGVVAVLIMVAALAVILQLALRTGS